MKKLLMSLGTIAAVAAPVAAVVACGKVPTTPGKTPGTTPGKTPGTTLGKTMTLARAKLLPESENPFKSVKEDGFYVWDKNYGGVLWNDERIDRGSKSTDHTIRLVDATARPRRHVVEMGRLDPTDKTELEDSIYMVYDADDTDGVTIDNFTSTVTFDDSSVARSKDITEVNSKVFGNPTDTSDGQQVSFKEDKDFKYQGEINTYIGGQNNHVSEGEPYSSEKDFFTYMNKFVNEFNSTNPEVVNKLFDYYGVKLDSSGKAVNDPESTSHASRGFAPVFYKEPIFTYERVFKNVIKITYHDRDGFQSTASHFAIHPEGKDYVLPYGEFSLGRKDWPAYHASNAMNSNDDNSFVGIKNPETVKDIK